MFVLLNLEGCKDILECSDLNSLEISRLGLIASTPYFPPMT